jgi:hypothetical protein
MILYNLRDLSRDEVRGIVFPDDVNEIILYGSPFRSELTLRGLFVFPAQDYDLTRDRHGSEA